MRHTVFWSILAIVITGLLTLGLAREFYWPEDLTRRPADASADSQPVETGSYCLGTYQGRLAIFLPGQEDPEMLFDVYIQQLPAYDQGQLEQGIWVDDYQTLVQTIEDYIS